MKLIRYIAAFIGFLVGWIGAAILVGLIMVAIFPGPGVDHNVLGDWRSWPGSVLGVLVGYRLFRLLAKIPKRSDAR